MWHPSELSDAGPRYLALVQALERDISTGRVAPLTRLPPQRELAYRLGLSVGTVTRAYAIAAQRGLVVGEVGRGTFICDDALSNRSEDGFFGDGATAGGPIDLSLNVPPLAGEPEQLAGALRSLAGAPAVLEELLHYLPHQGLGRHRHAIANWIAQSGFTPAADRIVLCHGAQHAMHVVLNAVCREGDTVLAERVTYPGFKAAATALRLKLHPVEIDDEGLLPDALETACEETGARVIYAMPTLQNPTCATMSPQRREHIAEIIRKFRLTLIEDDVYGFLHATAPPPLATLEPEQTFYIGSLSKCLAPGLRLGFVAAPLSRIDPVIVGVRASAWMATPVMAEIAARWIGDGTALAVANAKQSEARRRRAIAEKCLGANRLANLRGGTSFHAWLQLSENENAALLATRAAAQGVIITPPDAVSVGRGTPNGLRICFGAAKNEEQLRFGLEVIADILNGIEPTRVRSYV